MSEINNSEIKIGEEYTVETVVTQEMLAVNVGSGDVGVYATPMMMAIMEEAAAKNLAQFLDDDSTSVGTFISSSHMAATPVSMKVTAKAEITAVQGRKVSFKISAFDGKEQIGEGTHERVIVNRERFYQKALNKL